LLTSLSKPSFSSLEQENEVNNKRNVNNCNFFIGFLHLIQPLPFQNNYLLILFEKRIVEATGEGSVK
jgi:hypothetical protein